MSKKKSANLDRRDFFRKASLGAGALGVAAAGFSANSTAAEPAKTSAKGAGYQETDHVKKFYELARF